MKLDSNIISLSSTIKSHVFLVKDKKGYTLIDASYPGDGEKIINELKKLKIDLNKIYQILITHSDYDHIGSLKYLYDHLNAKVYCSKTEYDNWFKKSGSYPGIPELIKHELVSLKKILKPITKSTIGEFEVISTPYKFHSYGMNMYLYKDVLFCGDMVQSVGKLVPIISKFNLDNEIYVDYLRKFDIKGINTICPSHGPSVSINEWHDLIKLIDTYNVKEQKTFKQWSGFKAGNWTKTIDVRDFIQKNYTPYLGNKDFLAKPTKTTITLLNKLKSLFKLERENGGIIGMDTRLSGIDAYKAGYLDKKLEKIVGIQTEQPLVRAYMPIGGIRTAVAAAQAYNIPTDEKVDEIFLKYRKTHNQGVFDAYTEEMRKARHTHVITGLPDNYGRGRIIGDYRRVALYGIDYLINEKRKDKENLVGVMNNETIQLREEISEQISSLIKMKQMANTYGYDISLPAGNAHECIQWTYFAYLAAIKEQNGAAMSIGRVSTFFDIYIEKDIKAKKLTEASAQELIDHFVMKLRMVRFMRAPAYNDLFSGDPVWATESIGGMGENGKTLVTKTSYRFLHTLNTMGPAPEPNMTVLWSNKLPKNFKDFCIDYSIKYSSIQYENDDLMRPMRGDDYGIACCVSPMKIGKEMQFFGARCNLAKTLLYAINGGVDEIDPTYQIGPKLKPLSVTKPLNYDEVMSRFKQYITWLTKLYINTLNVIHYMHDKYYYEAAEMSLYDSQIHRFFATGLAGFSIVVDSLSAIKYAKVTPVWKKTKNGNVAAGFNIKGDYPKYGNDDDKVDKIGIELLKYINQEMKKNDTYRKSEITTSILTITSNVVYGHSTGSTPDGRERGCPFAPGANPMYHRDCCGAIASLNSVAKLPFKYAMDGISNTFTITPDSLGKTNKDKVNNLVDLLDGYFSKNAQHLNVNVLNKEMLIDAQKHPENYPDLTIRVSGYAVNFIKLTKNQQDDVINRTFHDRI